MNFTNISRRSNRFKKFAKSGRKKKGSQAEIWGRFFLSGTRRFQREAFDPRAPRLAHHLHRLRPFSSPRRYAILSAAILSDVLVLLMFEPSKDVLTHRRGVAAYTAEPVVAAVLRRAIGCKNTIE